MDETRALVIVSALADGINPHTGQEFPADSPYQTADIVRALLLASRALEARTKAQSRNTRAPENAGKRWTVDEDAMLLSRFDAGDGVGELARAHGRTPAGIQARLERHGRMSAVSEGASENAGRTWRSFAQRGERGGG